MNPSSHAGFSPATELAASIRARNVSPVEITGTALDRIAAAQPVPNEFVTIAEDAAMAQAR
jgi:Asp-tRNA(Asn)/Glu-tRNA(Gln) amidotransferase A subunit family amidase